MNRVELLNLLAAHADALNGERDNAALLLATYPETTTIWPLILLARSVKQALTPLRPHPAFRHDLRKRLQVADYQRQRATHGRWWWGAAVLGSLLSVTGLLLLFRYSRPVFLDVTRRL
jgi:hypothetical protein